MKTLENNNCILTGKSCKDFAKHCITKGENFYSFYIDVKRNSGVIDKLKVIISEKLLNKDIIEADFLNVLGQIRTYDKENGGIDIYLFAKDINIEKEEKYFNKVELTGYICKKGKARETNSGRKVIDFIVAINRLFRKSDYLPVLAWNKDVNYINNINISSEVSIVGRFQSRAYYKKDCDGNLIEKIAYEISSSKILSKENTIDELILG